MGVNLYFGWKPPPKYPWQKLVQSWSVEGPEIVHKAMLGQMHTVPMIMSQPDFKGDSDGLQALFDAFMAAPYNDFSEWLFTHAYGGPLGSKITDLQSNHGGYVEMSFRYGCIRVEVMPHTLKPL
jgi:hypothetical protein